MQMPRRKFVKVMAGSVATGIAISGSLATAADQPAIKAILFDAFPIFDPRPVLNLMEQLRPGHGAELVNLWRTRQFEYTWLRSLGGQYQDFWKVTQDALAFASASLKIDLSAGEQRQLMETHLSLKPWPDVPAALDALRHAGIRLGFLSNFTPAMLASCLKNSGLDGVFEHVLSTDAAHTYKPDPKAYQLGVDALKLAREEIVFAAFASWDAAGAKWFGYPTYWVNRLQTPTEELGVKPDATMPTLTELQARVLGKRG